MEDSKRRNWKQRLMVLVLVLVVSITAFPRTPAMAQQVGWVKDAEGYYNYYNSDGNLATGWQVINNEYYKFDDTGKMLTGLQQSGERMYFLGADGALQYGWQRVNGTWRYFKTRYLSNGSERIDAGAFVDTAADVSALEGIDVARYQGNIDWTAVKNYGIDFAFVKLGSTNVPVESHFAQNMAGANSAGIPAGVYFYSYAQSEYQAVLDAQTVIDNLQGYTVSYPVAIDLEDASQRGLGKQQITGIAIAFCNEIAAAGYTPMIYCNEDWYRNYIDFNQLPGIQRWIAKFDSEYTHDISRNIWQGSSTTRIDGIDGNVDLSFSYIDYSQIIPPRTAVASNYTKRDGSWVQNQTGWWYSYFTGGYPANQWKQIGGQWYWFDARGYMQTGWLSLYGNWYYLNGSGAMVTGWAYVDGHWFYMDPSGPMRTGWQYINGTWYFMSGSGDMLTGWQYINGNWYYLNGSGAMVTGWAYLGNHWFLMNDSGAMVTGWQYVNGAWYYMGASGDMLTGWQYINGAWYYMGASGDMLTGWQYINGNWFFLDASGAMLTGWQYINGNWFYMDGDGAMASSCWVGNYYVDGYGAWVH